MKVAIVTGAGSGIGRASALALLKAGYRVVLAGPPRRRPAADGRAGRRARGANALAVATDATRPGLGEGALRGDAGALRPARRALQQRRHRRAAGAARGADRRAVEGGGRHQPDRRLPLHAAGLPADEEPDARAAAGSSTTARSRRTRRGPSARPTPRPSTRSPASPSRPRSTAGPTTSPAARSTSATRRPR